MIVLRLRGRCRRLFRRKKKYDKNRRKKVLFIGIPITYTHRHAPNFHIYPDGIPANMNTAQRPWRLANIEENYYFSFICAMRIILFKCVCVVDRPPSLNRIVCAFIAHRLRLHIRRSSCTCRTFQIYLYNICLTAYWILSKPVREQCAASGIELEAPSRRRNYINGYVFFCYEFLGFGRRLRWFGRFRSLISFMVVANRMNQILFSFWITYLVVVITPSAWPTLENFQLISKSWKYIFYTCV